MSGEKSVFSEQEVGDIVRRAAELQERSPERGPSYTPGVTREQLERVAEEVGVEPQFLLQAIREQAVATQAPRATTFLQQEERVVAGELDPNNFDLILSQLRSRGSRRRPATQIGRTLRAQVWTGSGFANLEVTSRNDRTRVRLKPFPLLESMATLYPAFFTAAIAGSALANAGHGVASAVVAAASFVSGALGLRFWVGQSNRAAKQLADKIDGIVAQEVARQQRVSVEPEPEQTATASAADSPGQGSGQASSRSRP